MKNITIGLFATVLIAFTSCSSNETLNLNSEAKTELLKTFKVQQDINGMYSLDYTVNSNTAVQKSKSVNSNEIFLFSGETAGKEAYTEALTLKNNKLSVDFISDNNFRTSFVVEDDNIVLEKGKENAFLQEYSLERNEDGTYQLDFRVRNGITVTFAYNEAEGAYEINLKEGKSNNNQTTFSKTFVKDSNDLKIDFVNFLDSQSRETNITRPKRPRMIVVS